MDEDDPLQRFISDPTSQPWSPEIYLDYVAALEDEAVRPDVDDPTSASPTIVGSELSPSTSSSAGTSSDALFKWRHPLDYGLASASSTAGSGVGLAPALAFSIGTLSTSGPQSVSASLMLKRQVHDGLEPLSEADVDNEVGSADGIVQNAFPNRTLILEEYSAGAEAPIYFPCPFHFMPCNKRHLDEQQWREHALTHFRGGDPPTTVACPLSECGTADALNRSFGDDGVAAWDARMDHMAAHHRAEQGLVLGILSDRRKEASLHKHLFSIRVLSGGQYARLMSKGTLEGCERPLMMSEGRRSQRNRATGQLRRPRQAF